MSMVAVVQARYSSQRLPGKVLREVAGRPLLAYLLERLACCRALEQTVVATSSDADDDAIERFCKAIGMACFRGDLHDVLGRFIAAAQWVGCDALVRINGDSPLMDPAIVDRGVGLFEEGAADLVTNVHPRSFPKGESVEVVAVSALRRAASLSSDSQDREHVTRYLYRHPEQFRIRNFKRAQDVSDIQLSVDTPEDFAAFAALVARMDRPQAQYGLDEILALRAAATHR
jgi:spore coat polysaccharide biosynthesis protein SpsF (cytidylyltransferase family)